MNHTPIPWQSADDCGDSGHRAIYDAKGGKLALVFRKGDDEFIIRAANLYDDLLKALKAATERMEAVAEGIPVENRAKGVSQATHVRHMAGHLAQHAKIARAVIAKAEERT